MLLINNPWLKKTLYLSLLLAPLATQGQSLKASKEVAWELPAGGTTTKIRVHNLTGGQIRVYVTPAQNGATLNAITLTCRNTLAPAVPITVSAGSTAVCQYGANATDELAWNNFDGTKIAQGTYKIEDPV